MRAIVSRLIVLNATGLAVMAALAWAGLLSDPYWGPAAPGVWSITLLTALGVATVRRRPAWTEWLRDHMTVVGLIGTVIGLIDAMSNLTFGGSPEETMAGVAQGIGLALFSTLSGLIGYLWLELNLRVPSK